MLIDQISDKPGEVLLRQPLIQRRRDQQQLVRLERSEDLVHWPGFDQRRLHRCHLEKTLIILFRWHTEVSQRSPDQRSTPTSVLRTHAPRGARPAHSQYWIPNCDEKGVVRGVEVVSTSSGAERENRTGGWPAYG